MFSSLMTKRAREEYGKYEHLDFAPLAITLCHGDRSAIQSANHSVLHLCEAANNKLLCTSIPGVLGVTSPGKITSEESINLLLFDITNEHICDGANILVCIVSNLKLTENQG